MTPPPSALPPSPHPLVDDEARRRIAEELETTFVVEASAGTGKTTALVARLVALLASGRTHASAIVATTFTEKAAGELVVRLREELEFVREVLRARSGAPTANAARREAHVQRLVDAYGGREAVRRRLERALRELETARIGTIHGFASDLLRERPIEAGLDPSFRVLSEEESLELAERAVGHWLEGVLARPTEWPALARLARRKLGFGETLRDVVVRAAVRLADQRDLDAPWATPAFERSARIDEALAALRTLAPLLAPIEAAIEASEPSASLRGDKLVESLRALVAVLRELELAETLRGARDDDGLEEALRALAQRDPKKDRGRGKKVGPLLRDDVLAARDAALAVLAAFRRDADADLAARLRPELLRGVAEYEAQKRARGLVDYADLLLVLRRLLVEREDVRAELQARFTHVLVDEVQDVDPVQYDVVRLLVADDPRESRPDHAHPRPGKLFVVGDPKQAIYRFRRADLAAYHAQRARLLAEGAVLLHLTTSFRSAPSIQAAVNGALAPALDDYVPLSPFRDEPVGRPSVVVLPVPAPYGRFGSYFDESVRGSYAEAVVAFVAWLVRESGWTVDVDGVPTPIAPHHVAILFRSMQSAWGPERPAAYVRGLEARGIGVRSTQRRAFYEREEIHALRTVLAAIEHPDDELAVYGALAGPFMALSDAELFVYQRTHGPLHPLRVPKKDDDARPTSDEAVADGLRLLRALHVGRNHRPIADTIQRFLEATRAHVGLALQPRGERALANVAHLVTLARNAEARGVLSFRRFVDDLEARAEEGRHTDVTTEDDTTPGVEILTVHGAKGLEFPVVVLADPTSRSFDRPSSYTDRARGLHVERIAGLSPIELTQHEHAAQRADEDEQKRLLYVAATRARDLLVVPGAGDDALSAGWCTPLERALRPDARARRAPRAALGCPPLGLDSVRTRHPDVEHRALDAVMPGAYTLRFTPPPTPSDSTTSDSTASDSSTSDSSTSDSSHPSERRAGVWTSEVVWWGPDALPPEEARAEGVRAQDLLRPSPASDDGARRARELATARSARLDRGASPAGEREPLSVLAEKPLAAASLEVEPSELVIDVALAPLDGPASLRAEALVRAALVVLLDAPSAERSLDALRAHAPAALDYAARTLRHDARERDVAELAIAALLATPAFGALASTPRLRTDVHVALTTFTGSLGEGRVLAVADLDEGPHALGVVLGEATLEVRRTELGLAATALLRAAPSLAPRASLFVVRSPGP